MYVCLCKGLTETDVQRIVCERRLGPMELITALKLNDDDCCGRCAKNVHELLALAPKNPSCVLRRPIA